MKGLMKVLPWFSHSKRKFKLFCSYSSFYSFNPPLFCIFFWHDFLHPTFIYIKIILEYLDPLVQALFLPPDLSLISLLLFLFKTFTLGTINKPMNLNNSTLLLPIIFNTLSQSHITLVNNGMTSASQQMTQISISFAPSLNLCLTFILNSPLTQIVIQIT